MSSKVAKIIRWVLVGILTIQFLAAGVAKLFGAWDSMFIQWGYPVWFALVVGFTEVLVVIGLYLRTTIRWALIVIVLIMLGAAYTHVMANEYSRLIHNTGIILVVVIIFSLDNKDVKKNG